MYLNEDMACCGLQEIDGLTEHDSPKEAMLAFVGRVITKNRYTRKTETNISNIYIFSGVESVTDPKITTYVNGEDEPNCDYDDARYAVKLKYASEFAKFIRRNKLGVLKASPPRANILNHPHHIVKCWIWCPDVKALKAWYNKHYR